jgi:hypothetical protein
MKNCIDWEIWAIQRIAGSSQKAQRSKKICGYQQIWPDFCAVAKVLSVTVCIVTNKKNLRNEL